MSNITEFITGFSEQKGRKQYIFTSVKEDFL